MKRSEVVELIACWGKDEIFEDVYSCKSHPENLVEWADNLLYTLETELGMFPPYVDKTIEGHLCTINEWEPEDDNQSGKCNCGEKESINRYGHLPNCILYCGAV